MKRASSASAMGRNAGARRHQRGVILISALIISAMAAVVAAALFFDAGLVARRAAANFGLEQALQIARGAEALAAQTLRDDTGQTDTPQDSWAQQVDPVELEAGIILEAKLDDLSGRFNVNSLINAYGQRDENAMKVFTRLLQLSGLETRWAEMVADWIDPDTQPAPDGAEDGFYQMQKPPHRAANMAITSLSELLQMPEFTLEMYRKLAPHITALPASARTINVCMADGVVLDALFALHQYDQSHEEYSRLSTEELAQRRESGCYPQRSALTSGQQAMQQMSVERTTWFGLRTWVTIGTAQFALYSLMQRQGSGQIQTVARSLGSE